MSADAYLTLAECAHREGEWHGAYDYAKRAIALGKPETMLAVNPSEYVLHPRMIMASSARSLGDIDEAVRLANEALGSPGPKLDNPRSTTGGCGRRR
jgi:hypothetical protein